MAIHAAPIKGQSFAKRVRPSLTGMIASADCGHSPQSDRSVVSAYNDLEIVWNGPFGRADDAAGLACAHTHMGSGFRTEFSF